MQYGVFTLTRGYQKTHPTPATEAPRYLGVALRAAELRHLGVLGHLEERLPIGEVQSLLVAALPGGEATVGMAAAAATSSFLPPGAPQLAAGLPASGALLPTADPLVVVAARLVVAHRRWDPSNRTNTGSSR